MYEGRSYEGRSYEGRSYEGRSYDGPPVYSSGYSAPSAGLYAPRSVLSPRSQHPYPESLYPEEGRPRSQHPYPESLYPEEGRPRSQYPYPESLYPEEARPQPFYRWWSPPSLVKTFQGSVVLMCFLIFACVASTLVWEMHGYEAGLGGYRPGASGGTGGVAPGYYGGSYGYSSSYMTPYSAKLAMIAMAAVNFLASLAFLVGSFSRSHALRGRRFYLTVFVCDVVLAALQAIMDIVFVIICTQAIMDIVFVIGVNPTAQSSQSALYNPALRLCQSMQGAPSLSGGAGAGFPGGFPMYSQYLQHYCWMDPEEAAALVLGLLVTVALTMAAYYSCKTRSKIWRHGKDNIYWDQPGDRDPEGRDIQDWVDHVGEGRSLQRGHAPEVKADSALSSSASGTAFVYSEGAAAYAGKLSGPPLLPSNHDNANSRAPEPQGVSSPGQSEPGDSVRKPPRALTPPPEAESQYETGDITGDITGGDTADDLDQDRTDLLSVYPEITSDRQRRHYKREFDLDLTVYKSLCAHTDDITDQLHKLSRELDTLDESSAKYQGVAEEYNRLKDLKRTPDYRAKRRQSRELRQKLFHIKSLVKKYDAGLC